MNDQQQESGSYTEDRLPGEAEPALGPEQADVAALMMFTGPLPPPMILESYVRLVPGLAKEMHELTIAKARHEMEVEKIAAQAKIEDRSAERNQFRRGQWLAFVLALTLIICGTACILMSHDWAGATIITGTLASLVLAFMWGKRSAGKAEQREEKDEGEESGQ